MSIDRILLEDGSRTLLESGDALLLESSSPTTGVRGMAAPWLGGASVAAIATRAGFRGLLGLWVGGATGGTGGGGPGTGRHPWIILARRRGKR